MKGLFSQKYSGQFCLESTGLCKQQVRELEHSLKEFPSCCVSSLMIRMEDESLEDRSVEVLQIPSGVDDDLLWLYFENRRRSGGGNVISLDRTGDKALLVFENAEGETCICISVFYHIHCVLYKQSTRCGVCVCVC